MNPQSKVDQYTQSRKMAELIAIWAGNRSGEYADKISAYRAGLLAAERRKIESKLASGELLAVISTSALELGIDIGDLDLCLLVGYPGSVVSTWQRGGRVGRSGQDSAIFLIAGEDALDQYFLRNPDEFLRRKPETAVVNPFNPDICLRHIICAATEILKIEEKRSMNGVRTYMGKIRVTEHVTEYEVWDIETRTIRKRVPLDLPPQVFETESLWFQVSDSIQSVIEARRLDFMGGLHAVEHAAIGVFPLLVMADRNDTGGLSTLYHDQVRGAAIFVYDGIPGGAGMTRQAFDNMAQLFEHALTTISECVCESGCPSCIHSPQCGNGNRPMDKYAQIDFSRINTLDILEDVYRFLGYRLSLAHLAEVNLKSRKSADGLQALKWWQEGRIDEILRYCRQDVRITRDLYLYGQQHGYLLFRDKSEKILRIPVNW